MEELFAYAYLWAWNLDKKQVYRDALDKMFIESPDNELLLELEGMTADYKGSFFRIKRYFDYECNIFDTNSFVEKLFEGLEKAYKSDEMEIMEFAKCAYEIWKTLPCQINDKEEPFWTLCYADDPLSWGDEIQNRKLYEKAFDYYKTGK